MDVEYATNQELIDELTRRTNFVGVIIYSTKEHRPGMRHSLQIASTIVPEETAVVLESALGAYHNPLDKPPVGSSDEIDIR